ncbi:hypothetical protein BOX15_Mlig021174g1 [Macrostomum lignano]|uniref:CTCK domain-containing protein n=1 Tax=Macrostomum lignano TaxID=282301 RepID=A0A267DRH3_9PLAT|nr:hypothetical protein BOX15_Mlig021174g1 [Macrostomum lignano]
MLIPMLPGKPAATPVKPATTATAPTPTTPVRIRGTAAPDGVNLLIPTLSLGSAANTTTMAPSTTVPTTTAAASVSTVASVNGIPAAPSNAATPGAFAPGVTSGSSGSFTVKGFVSPAQGLGKANTMGAFRVTSLLNMKRPPPPPPPRPGGNHGRFQHSAFRLPPKFHLPAPSGGRPAFRLPGQFKPPPAFRPPGGGSFGKFNPGKPVFRLPGAGSFNPPGKPGTKNSSPSVPHTPAAASPAQPVTPKSSASTPAPPPGLKPVPSGQQASVAPTKPTTKAPVPMSSQGTRIRGTAADDRVDLRIPTLPNLLPLPTSPRTKLFTKRSTPSTRSMPSIGPHTSATAKRKLTSAAPVTSKPLRPSFPGIPPAGPHAPPGGQGSSPATPKKPTTVATTTSMGTRATNSWVMIGGSNCTCTSGKTTCVGGHEDSLAAWSTWTAWSNCSAHCGQGKQYRFRQCSGPACVGNGHANESRACTGVDCYCVFSRAKLQWLLTDDYYHAEMWVERDGKPGLSSPLETVNDGDRLESGSVLQVGCLRCTCKDGGFACKLQRCASDCQWSAWQPWATCSATCGGGLQTRLRTIHKPAVADGAPCQASGFTDTQACNLDPCPGCSWSSWSQWSNCTGSATSDIGVRERRRQPIGSCKEADRDLQPCQLRPAQSKCKPGQLHSACHNVTGCEVACSAGANARTLCSQTDACLSGCLCPKGQVMGPNGQCVATDKCRCLPKSINCSNCFKPVCLNGQPTCLPDMNCQRLYTEWSAWSACSAACGEGLSHRTRQLLQEGRRPAGCGKSDLIETRHCNARPCGYACKDRNGDLYTEGQAMPALDQCSMCFCRANRTECVSKAKVGEPVPTPVWSAWSTWSSCVSAAANNRRQERRRRCVRICPDDPRKCGEFFDKEESVEWKACLPKTPLLKRDCIVSPDWIEGTCYANCMVRSAVARGFRTLYRRILQLPANGGAPCPELRREDVPCTKTCPVDCSQTAWSAWGACVRASNSGCSGLQVRSRGVLVPPANGGRACEDAKQLRSCLAPGCQTSACRAPMTKQPLQQSRCIVRCSDLASEDKCAPVQAANAAAVNATVCACPAGQYEQDGRCVAKQACRCRWNEELMGQRSPGTREEFAAGERLVMGCKNCTCQDGVFKCNRLSSCSDECHWSNWRPEGKCTAGCRLKPGLQKFVRSPRNSDYLPTKACQGPSVKYELCSSTRSCDSLCPSGQRYNEFGECDEQCYSAGSLGQPQRQRCPEQACVCARGLVKRGDSCVPKSECYKCSSGNTTLPDGGYSVDLAACQIVTCDKGRTSAVPLSVDQMPACSLEDERIAQSAPKAKDPNRCCYRASASACSREEVSISKLDDSCLLTSPIRVPHCRGQCPQASPLIAPRRSDVVAAEVAAADSSQVYLLKLPGAHCTGCLPDRVQYSPTTLTVKCKSGESRQLRMPIVGACHCKQVPCPST